MCAGVCAAVALTASLPSEAAASARAVRINLGSGDYVEACYTYMARSPLTWAAAFTGASIAGAIVTSGGARSSAYLPLPVAWAVAGKEWPILLYASGVAFVVPFAGTLLAARLGQLARPTKRG